LPEIEIIKVGEMIKEVPPGKVEGDVIKVTAAKVQ
jgi:hypothetical protein